MKTNYLTPNDCLTIKNILLSAYENLVLENDPKADVWTLLWEQVNAFAIESTIMNYPQEQELAILDEIEEIIKDIVENHDFYQSNEEFFYINKTLHDGVYLMKRTMNKDKTCASVECLMYSGDPNKHIFDMVEEWKYGYLKEV